MCTQSVGLLAGVLEAAGIATVCLALLRDVARWVRIPRALALPFPFGRPFGGRGPFWQHRVIEQALRLLTREGVGPMVVDFEP
jgi:hypothetical protein